MIRLGNLFSRIFSKCNKSASVDDDVSSSRVGSVVDTAQIDALLRYAIAFIQRQDWVAADRCVAELVACGASIQAVHVRAHVLRAQGRYQDAVALFDKAIQDDPDNGDLYCAAGVLAMEYGDPGDAEYLLSQAIRYGDTTKRAHAALGNLLFAQGRTAIAATHLEMALRFDPGNAELRQRVAHTFWERGDLPTVAMIYEQGLCLTPDCFDFHLRAANCYREMGDIRAAEKHIARALELQPGHRTASLSYAQLLVLLGDSSAALACVQAVLDKHPDDALVHWTMARILLGEGRFSEAWPHHENGLPQRLQNNRFGESSKPWCGESLVGKRVLIYGEQGLGDEIMFASCLPDVLRHASTCVIECAPKLEKLFVQSFPGATIHAQREGEGRYGIEPLVPMDYEIPCGTLPSVLRRKPEDFPSAPFLRVPDTSRDHWRHRLAALGAGISVGISWRGGTKTTGSYARSIALDQWLPILRVPGVSFVNLQYTDCLLEVSAIVKSSGVSITTWQDGLDDYFGTAALVSGLDLVISVCTSVVTLASGLGTPVWVMAPPSAGWMFLRGQERTPWLPTAKVFWQDTALDWAPVIQRVAEELAQRVQHSAITSSQSEKSPGRDA